MTVYKYDGAGNDFVVIDGRGTDVGICRKGEFIRTICDRKSGLRAADGRIGADGLMILDAPAAILEGEPQTPATGNRPVFRMEYYNSDGSGGMMCGNGGRCIVAFADRLGIVGEDGSVVFEAPDGLHSASVTGRRGECLTVCLKMLDVKELVRYEDGWFLDTGTRHFVCFRQDIEAVDVEKEGAVLRHDGRFAPQGANVNFVSPRQDSGIAVRTFEKGVEAETLACGTGITASAIASYAQGIEPTQRLADGAVSYAVQARRDPLSVSFRPSGPLADLTAAGELLAGLVAGACAEGCPGESKAGASGVLAQEVYLTGPATFVGAVEIAESEFAAAD